MTTAGEKGVADAFHYYVNTVDKKGHIPNELWDTGFFSYLLTDKQKAKIKRICKDKGWHVPKNIQGITIKGHFIKHVLNSRVGKDNITPQECADILTKSFHKNGEIGINTKYKNQGVILNSKNSVQVQGNSRYSMAVFNVEDDNLSPVTAYDADRAKIIKIKGR